MAAPLDPAVAAEMRARAKAVADRQQSGNFTKSWNLSGKSAIVEPGKGVVVRLLPRWDIASSMTGPAGQRVPNPSYKPGFAFVVAYEHWWEPEGGRYTREFCPKTVDPQAECVVCISAQAMKQSAAKDDRDFGKKIEAREVFIFNAVVGEPRRVDDAKLADIRIISCSGTLYKYISAFMAGDEESKQFARGDITSPKDGYDLLFKRPPAGGGERWSADCAPNASPLYGAAQQAAFKGWATRMTDLQEMLEKETKDAAGIFKAYYGRDPRPEELGGGGASGQQEQEQDKQQEAPGFGAQAGEEASSELPEGPDDEFMPKAAGAPAPKAQTQAPRGPAAPASPSPRGARAPRR